MNATLGINSCISFINSHLHTPHLTVKPAGSVIKCVTISRQSGCGAHMFAEELAATIQPHLPKGTPPWTIFDSTLVEAILQDQHLPAKLAQFMPEDKVLWLNDIIEDVWSLHPPTETLVRRASETILRLADLGGVIIVGRGGNIITARLPGMLHVRLIGSLEARAAHIEHFDKLSHKDALARIKREDTGRRRYLKRYFHQDIDDPLLYHLVINTDYVAPREAGRMVGNLALSHAPEAGWSLPKAA